MLPCVRLYKKMLSATVGKHACTAYVVSSAVMSAKNISVGVRPESELRPLRGIEIVAGCLLSLLGWMLWLVSNRRPAVGSGGPIVLVLNYPV